MTAENSSPQTVSDMLRLTGENTNQFMAKIAEHIEKLEARIIELEDQLTENQNDSNQK